MRRCICTNSSCGFCHYELKDVMHALRDCLAARNIWKLIVLDDKMSLFFLGDLHEWFGIPWSANEIIKVSYSWAKQYALSNNKATKEASQISPPLTSLGSNRVCLSSNGVVKEDIGFLVAGGVLWDQKERWIIGYHRYLGFFFCVMEAKLWGILDGLILLLKRSSDFVIIQTDNMETVQVIQDQL
ncbi:hypothetical protein Gohar_019972 [Gossypium harknessii]|uniref:RNase H type-1 domain-containing protein n=1 Tax=Gossypium harknessii TaxID=34285 RepID=A0A7J9HYZ4_9ROSI|nr:hypothetical protein [Gossypium harknessii]